MNQRDFAKIGGASKNSQISYEAGKTSPDAQYWEATARLGVDVQYVLTGTRSENLDRVSNRAGDYAPNPLALAERLDVQALALGRMLDVLLASMDSDDDRRRVVDAIWGPEVTDVLLAPKIPFAIEEFESAEDERRRDEEREAALRAMNKPPAKSA